VPGFISQLAFNFQGLDVNNIGVHFMGFLSLCSDSLIPEQTLNGDFAICGKS
jgi:hypothetical protein